MNASPRRSTARTISIALGVMAVVVVGVSALLAVREHRRQEALAEFAVHGATIEVESGFWGTPYGARVVAVDFSTDPVDSMIKLVANEDFDVDSIWSHTPLGPGNSVVTELRSFPELRVLRLESFYHDETCADDAGVQCLRELESLEELSLSGTQVTNAGLQVIRSLPRLKRLELGVTYPLNQGCYRNRTEIPPARIDDDGLLVLAGCPSLEEVSLRGMKVSDAGIAHLQTLPRLRALNLAGTEITDTTLQWLAAKASIQTVVLTEGIPVLVLSEWGIDPQTPTLVTQAAADDFRRNRPDVELVYQDGECPNRAPPTTAR